MKKKYLIALIASASTLAACVPHWDMQGHNPKEYYAEHPIENKVETRYITQVMRFDSSSMVDTASRRALHGQIAQISTMAIESVEVQLHPSQMHNEARKEQVRRSITKAGIGKSLIHYVAAEDVPFTEANVQIAYAAVVSPRCPDWRSGSVTSYSNMRYSGNISCATRTNLGLMVADPRDLVQGSGDNTPDTQGTTKAIQQYREGATEASTASDGGGTSGSSASGQ